MNRPKVALVLGGGGSRGIAHIGVLQVFQREHIPIDMVVGTSMGAIVGTLFALGVDPDRLSERMAKNIEGNNLFNLNMFSARARQKAVAHQLMEVMRDKTFADLNIPVTVMAVDMVSGEEIAIQEGDLLPAVLASSAVPGVFPPVEVDGRQLADGGVIDSLATHIAYAQGADKIIAVDVYPPLERDNPWRHPISAIAGIDVPIGNTGILPSHWKNTPSMAASVWRSVRVLTWHLHEKRLQEFPPHILLRPSVTDYGSLDFKDITGPLKAGVIEAEMYLEQIKGLVSASSARH